MLRVLKGVNLDIYRGEFVVMRPLWQDILIYASWAIVACLAVWGAFVIGNYTRRRKTA